jgi:hypothetical protein
MFEKMIMKVINDFLKENRKLSAKERKLLRKNLILHIVHTLVGNALNERWEE